MFLTNGNALTVPFVAKQLQFKALRRLISVRTRIKTRSLVFITPKIIFLIRTQQQINVLFGISILVVVGDFIENDSTC